MNARQYLKGLNEHDPVWDTAGEYEYTEDQLINFAERYHENQLKLLPIGVVTERLNWMIEEMGKSKPFSQSYNNLNERHSRLLEAKKILDKEGLWL